MVQTLEQYVAEATNAYKPAANAIQSQIDALQGNLDATNEIINRDYAQQQANLNLASNQAAEAASMQAAGNGGSFGGAGNLARRKYYEQSFVPAVTQLQTNRANDLASARQANENTKLQLNQSMANLQSQAANQALQQYNTATEAQTNRDFQAEQADITRKYQSEQAQLEREWQDYLADKRYKNEAIEAEKVRQHEAEQARIAREWQAEQARLEREFQAQQNAANRAAQRSAQTTNAQSILNELMNQGNGLKSWDFGNGYSITASPNGQALYYKNGNLISAGRFLEGTGASGANWNLWNDVWKNGVSTNGVGADTVSAFDRQSPSSANYGYLFN